jgi:hypothetical protein
LVLISPKTSAQNSQLNQVLKSKIAKIAVKVMGKSELRLAQHSRGMLKLDCLARKVCNFKNIEIT